MNSPSTGRLVHKLLKDNDGFFYGTLLCIVTSGIYPLIDVIENYVLVSKKM